MAGDNGGGSGMDKASKGEMESDEEIKLREAKAIEKDCNFFKDFLMQIKTRGRDDMSLESINAIEEMKKTMKMFLGQNNMNDSGAETEFSLGSKHFKSKKNSKGDKLQSSKASSSDRSTSEESSFESSQGSSRSSRGSSDVDSDKDKKLKLKQHKKKEKHHLKHERKSVSNMGKSNKRKNSLTEILKRFDNRQVPQQEKYNEESGQDLGKYFEKFDKYCRDNFKGDKDFWIGELEKHLGGKTLECFKSIRDFSDTYEDVKAKLMTWYKDESQLRKSRNRQKFKNARPKQGETLFLFSSRLETLFKLAYPKHNIQQSNTLIDQFQASISRSAKDIIRAQILSLRAGDKKVEWRKIQKWARLIDVEREKDRVANDSFETEDQPNDVKEIIVSLTADPSVHVKDTKLDSSSRKHIEQSKTDPYKYAPNCAELNRPNKYNNSNKGRPNHQRYNSSYDGNSYSANGYYQQKQDQNRGNYVSQDRSLYNGRRYNSSKGNDERVDGRPGVCYLCKRYGHFQRDCKMSSKSCFTCGSKDHLMRNCPRYNFRQNLSSQGGQQNWGRYQNPSKEYGYEHKFGSQGRFADKRRQSYGGYSSESGYNPRNRTNSDSYYNRKFYQNYYQNQPQVNSKDGYQDDMGQRKNLN